jgi:hydroxyethylthiazole kinase
MTSADPTLLDGDVMLARAVACLDAIRARRPRVHVLTNFVAMNVSANVLLAVGAVPSMTFRAEAMPDFVGTSEALVVNLGMLDAERESAIGRAVPAARDLGRPWLLDPVKVDRTGTRRELATSLLAQAPALLRSNLAELGSLAGQGEASGEAILLAPRLARSAKTVVAATGPVDVVADGDRLARIANGSELMDRVTAMGCACSALLGAFLAVERDPFLAAVAGLLVYGAAGEIAAERANGPGSFLPELLDTLYHLDAATLAERARLS